MTRFSLSLGSFLYLISFCVLVSSLRTHLWSPKSADSGQARAQASQAFEGYKIIEGDMLVEDVKPQTHAAAGPQVQDSGILFQGARWPHARIPYVISSDFGAWERDIIYGAMNEIIGSTCIRFNERQGWETGHYVFIQKHYGRVCNSVVGRALVKSPQVMTLGEGCVNHWTVLHELVHAVGFYHEQNRWDRDNYITILWNNIPQAHHHDFQKHGNSYDFGVGYDYGSIMHYAQTHFGFAGRHTIESKPPGISFGNARHLSFRDKLKINRMYSCMPAPSSTVPAPPPSPSPSAAPTIQGTEGSYSSDHTQYGPRN